MRIVKVVVVDTAGKAGMDFLHMNTADALRALGVQCEVWTTDTATPSPFVRKVFVAYSGKRAGRKMGYIVSSLRLPFLLRRSHASVLHLHFFDHPLVHVYWASMAHVMGISVVVTAHDITPLRALPADNLLVQLLYRLADRVVVLHPRLMDHLKRFSSKVVSIPHGSYGHMAKPSQPGEYVLFFGQLKRTKGLSVLLHALHLIEERGTRIRLVIRGPDVDRQAHAIAKQIQDLSLGGRVEFLPGYVPDQHIAPLIKGSAFLVLPYLNGYQSGVLHLAADYGKAVVATDIGAIGQTVREWGNGMVVSPNDPCDLARAIKTMWDDKQACEEFGARGRRRIREESSERTRLMLELYQELSGLGEHGLHRGGQG